MRKRTTTQKLRHAIKDNLLKPIKAEKYSKSTRKTTTISTDTFKDDLDFLCETIFCDAIGWHYEKNYRTGEYEADCSRMNGDVDIVIIVHLCACDDADKESIENALRVIEEE